MICKAVNKFPYAVIWAAIIYLSGAGDLRADAADDPLLLMVLLDQVELRDVADDNTFSWDAEVWLGKDIHKIWIKTDGEHTASNTDEAELQFLYSKAIARYWDFQFGVRHDLEPSPGRSWAVFGFKGLAPYFFDIDTAAFVGESGRVAFRFEVEYELFITQRLILAPDLEFNFYGQSDPDIAIGSGLSDVEAGIRLRYEIRRQFAPYIGVNWSKLFGNTADFAKIAGQDTSETQLVIGFRAWF